MDILILGATGYLGTHLISAILEQGDRPICVIRRTSYHSLEELGVLPEDIWYDDMITELLESRKTPIDCMVNCACQYCKPGVEDWTIIEANYNMPLRMFLHGVNYGINRFFTIGTGLPDDLNLYSKTKAQLADLLKWYSYSLNANNKPISVCNIMLENYYGKDEPSNRFLPSIIAKMQKNEPVLLTEGTQKRDFIHIDDVTRGIMTLIKQPFLLKYMDIPLGTGNAPTIRELVEYLHELLKSQSELRFGAIPGRAGEPDCIADTTLMKQYGIEITCQWQEGLKKII